MLYVKGERRSDKDTGNIKTSDNTMKLRETLAQTIGKLHWTEQKRTGSGQTMRKQPPLERLVVLPDRILRIDEEVLVVAENVSDHQTNEAKQTNTSHAARRVVGAERKK